MPDADVILWLVDSEAGLDKAQREIARRLPRQRAVVVAVNKIDLGAKERLLPILAQLAALLPGCELIPISARTGENVDTLLSAIERLLPEGPRYYPGEEITDESERSIVAEIVREKVMLETEQEVPYAVAVTVDEFERATAPATDRDPSDDSRRARFAERHSHRPGRAAPQVHRPGARASTSSVCSARKVYLELFVRVQPEWTRRAALLQEFGL